MSFLELKGVEKTYPDGTKAVRGIDLSIREGEFVVLLGPSGCGKTTTLRMIAGLELATGGSITLAGRDVTALRPSQRDVGMVFQFYALYPHLSVRENIAFPLRSAGLPRPEVERRVEEVAGRMGLQDLLRRHPKQLSGGDQQRVSLARAMVRRPAVYLMDEPLGTLDADQRAEMREFIRARQLESKVTTIYVTHDQEEAMSLADRVVVMEGGRIRQAGAPAEVYDKPASLFVANFVGSPGMNVLAAEATPDGRLVARGADLALPLTRTLPAGPLRLGIRGEHVHEDPAGPLEGRVLLDEYVGAYRNTHLDTPAGRLIVRSTSGTRRAPGESMRVRLDPARIRLFDPAGGGAL
jgi:multiple sugar transport system ATP-binding protein